MVNVNNDLVVSWSVNPVLNKDAATLKKVE